MPLPASLVTKPRTLFNVGCAEVFAYPSVGGHVRKHVSRVELDWLGLTTACEHETADENTPVASDRIHAYQNPDEENAFALRLMQIGGHWWSSEKLHRRYSVAEYPYGYHYPADLDIGFTPAGVVLVLQTWADNCPTFGHIPEDPPMKPETWSRLRLCSSMQERCSVLRDFGAIAYESIGQCPHLPSSLEEGIAKGKRYEELMKRLDNTEYLEWWLSSS